jgi:hypothetical protein
LGFAYYKRQSDSEGLSLMNEGLEMELKLTIPMGVLKAICIWPIFYKNRDYQKSKENALQAYKVATNIKVMND